jgi:predicted small lipoprotein YifL
MKRLLRALIVLATSTLVVCGVKGPPHPPTAASDAGAPGADGGAAAPDGGGQ